MKNCELTKLVISNLVLPWIRNDLVADAHEWRLLEPVYERVQNRG
jgi:hypothetical protein